jgi:hypothetical protein
MLLLDVLLGVVAVACLAALGRDARSWLPWRALAISFAGLLGTAAFAYGAASAASWGLWPGLAAAAAAGLLVVAATWWGSGDLRAALAR